MTAARSAIPPTTPPTSASRFILEETVSEACAGGEEDVGPTLDAGLPVGDGMAEDAARVPRHEVSVPLATQKGRESSGAATPEAKVATIAYHPSVTLTLDQV